MDMPDLKALQVLVAVERHGGFAPAARALGLTRAAVSRSIGQLEKRLGLRLARRTTRRVVPSEAAHALVRALAGPLEQLDAALAQAAERPGQLAGTVRLAASQAFGRDVVLPLLAAFQRAHPALKIEVRLNDRLDDLIAQPIDIAVRLGPLPGGSMVARKVGTLAVVLAAAPALFAGRRPPRTIEELAGWPAVGFRVPGSERLLAWPFTVAGRRHLWTPAAVTLEVDSVDAVAALARAGAGIALLPRHLVAEDLTAGRLLALLKDAVAAGPEVHVCYASRTLVPARVRALIEHLVVELPAMLRAG